MRENILSSKAIFIRSEKEGETYVFLRDMNINSSEEKTMNALADKHDDRKYKKKCLWVKSFTLIMHIMIDLIRKK